ncbi:hypothetical protein JCM3774_005329 [Rhodotorula dairenensis]
MSKIDARPLAGIRVLELAGLAPAPFAGLVLADFGADVVRVDRSDASFSPDTLTRGKRSLAVSLKAPEGIALLRKLLSPADSSNTWRADVLIDPFRPGVLERLGLDPKELLERNPRLIIARLTGFRREGPYSHMAGHDINYLALSGVLAMLGRKGDKPYAPANTLADFAGGGLMAVVGILAAVIERASSGKGQLVEVDMVTGTRYAAIFPLTVSHPASTLPMWDRPRGENALDGGAPWYDVYECKDGRYMSLGAIENHFYAEFLRLFLGALPADLRAEQHPRAEEQLDRASWPRLTAFLATGFRTRTRDDWTALFLGTDACCVPVLEPLEVDKAGQGPHEAGTGAGDANSSLIDFPSPAPRLGRTPAVAPTQGSIILRPGSHSADVLAQAGLGAQEVQALIQQGAVGAGGNKARL